MAGSSGPTSARDARSTRAGGGRNSVASAGPVSFEDRVELRDETGPEALDRGNPFDTVRHLR